MNMYVSLFNKLVAVSQSNFKCIQMVTMPFHVQSLSGDADVSVYPHSKIMLKQYQLSMLLCYHRKLMYIIICQNLVGNAF